jgi:hypothetical protein
VLPLGFGPPLLKSFNVSVSRFWFLLYLALKLLLAYLLLVSTIVSTGSMCRSVSAAFADPFQQMMSCPVKLVTRFTLFAKRREDSTPEQFYEHWEKIHAPLTAPWLVKHKVLAYSQVAESEPSSSSTSYLT